jgi:hypothetical protein
MRKLKLALILPLIQLIFALIAIRLFNLQAVGNDSPDFPFYWQFCRGINLPGFALDLVMGTFLNLIGHGLERVNGWAWGEFVFLIGVAVQWSLIGYALDIRWAPIKIGHRPKILATLIYLLMLSIGLLLLGSAVRDFLGPFPSLNVVKIFIFLWSLILILFSGLQIRNRFAFKRSTSSLP